MFSPMKIRFDWPNLINVFKKVFGSKYNILTTVGEVPQRTLIYLMTPEKFFLFWSIDEVAISKA